MKLTFCALCGSTEAIEHHHILPKALGGTDAKENILTLCSTHHVALHKLNDKRIHSANLIREVKKAQKERGEWLGGHIPFGYRLKDNKLVKHKKEQLILKDITHQRVEGMPLRALKIYLEKEHGVIRSIVWIGEVTSE